MNDRELFFQHIRSCVESNNVPGALVQLRRELESHPGDSQILFWLGICLAEVGQFTEAEDYLHQAAILNPGNLEITNALEAIESFRTGDKSGKRPKASNFNRDESTEYKKKECSNCHRQIAVESWQCGYCKQLFWLRILVRLGIFFLVVSLFIWGIGGWYARIMGFQFQPGQVVNKAGDEGKRIEISQVEWNCIGLGLTQARGTGFNALVRGAIKNSGDRSIEKAVFTIFLQYKDGTDITFVWFDVYAWRPGEAIQFNFPGILPPARAERCELRVESVQLASSEPEKSAPLEFYVPSSDHFPAYRFAQGERTLAEKWYDYYKPIDPWSFRKLLRVYWEIFPAFLFNYLCVIVAVLLVNVCDPERVWNSEWRLDAIAAAFVVLGFVAINTITYLMMSMLGMMSIIAGLLKIIIFWAKLFLFYLFFRRSLGFTFLLIVFYICLTMTGMGLFYKIFGAS